MSTPIYDELEAKWSETTCTTRICDEYHRACNVMTGHEWFEDDEGNEVFTETLEFAKGGLVKEPAKAMLETFDTDCPVGVVPKRKFKLLGRNQNTSGTL